jgi:hypothetical protein
LIYYSSALVSWRSHFHLFLIYFVYLCFVCSVVFQFEFVTFKDQIWYFLLIELKPLLRVYILFIFVDTNHIEVFVDYLTLIAFDQSLVLEV